MGVVPEDVAKREPGKYIRGEEFEGNGVLLEVVSFGKGTSEQYGAKEDNWLVTEGKLEIGEVFVYAFKGVEGDMAGKERTFETNSPGFFIAFTNVNPDSGTKVRISRTGKTNKTRYLVSVV